MSEVNPWRRVGSQWTSGNMHAHLTCHYSVEMYQYCNLLTSSHSPPTLTYSVIPHAWTINEPHLPYKTRWYARSPTAQDMFRPIPGLISCTGVSGRWGLLYHAHMQSRLSNWLYPICQSLKILENHLNGWFRDNLHMCLIQCESSNSAYMYMYVYLKVVEATLFYIYGF